MVGFFSDSPQSHIITYINGLKLIKLYEPVWINLRNIGWDKHTLKQWYLLKVWNPAKTTLLSIHIYVVIVKQPAWQWQTKFRIEVISGGIEREQYYEVSNSF